MTLEGHFGWINECFFLSNDRAVSASHDNLLKIWNIKTSKCELTLDGHCDYVCSCNMLPDGKIISGSYRE